MPLNEKQLAAVTAPEEPLLVLAGAGSGKTRVLTARAAYMISRLDIPPSAILLVTFTTKAVKEMKERMASLYGLPMQTVNRLVTRHLPQLFLQNSLSS
ncbi:UvrD-helicase domain-containing protein [Bacillus licheniformis]